MTDPEQQPPATAPLTVVRLEVDSFQRLRAAHVVPMPTGLIPVRGRNAQGKSSLIGAMLDALGAERAELPINRDAHGGLVEVELAGQDPAARLIVRERLTRDAAGKAKRALSIEAADGSSVKGPAGVLKALRGRFADPVAFLDMAPADQVRTVLGVLGLDEELARLEQVAQGLYDRRRDLGRDADRLGKAAAELQAEFTGLPPAPTASVDELAAELQVAKDQNAARAAAQKAMETAESRGRAAAAQLERLRLEAERLEVEIVEQRDAWKAASEDLVDIPPRDLTPILEALRAHEEQAKAAGRREQAERTAAEASAARVVHAAVDAELEETRRAIGALLAGASFPVEGMSYDPDTRALTIDGIPFGAASQAERLKAAAAVAMAGSPTIRVMFAREGSLLDDESRVQLAELAEARGFQLWLEVVDSQAEGAGVWIEDGEVS